MIDFTKVLDEAESLSRTVTKSFSSKKFDNTFILNVLTLSLEKYLVAFLLSNDELPEGHTLSFLIERMGYYTAIPVKEIDVIVELDDKIQLCSLEVTAPFIPNDKEMASLIDTLIFIKEVVLEQTSAKCAS